MADTRIASVNVGLLADVGNFIQNIGAAEAKARSSFGAMQKTITGFGNAVGLAFGAASAIATLKYFDDIGTALNKMSVTVNDSTKNIKELQTIAMNVWRGTDADIKKATESVVQLTNKTNLTGAALQQAAIQAQQLASISGQDPNQIIKGTTTLANAYGKSTDDFVAINERLYKTTRATGIAFDDLLTSATEAQPIFSKLGLSLEDTEAFLGMLAKNGVSSETAIVSFRHALEKMSSEGVKDLHKGFNDLVYAIQSGKITAQEINDIFGKTAPMITKIFTDSKFSLDDTRKSIDAITQTIGGTYGGSLSVGEQFSMMIKELGSNSVDIVNSLMQTLISLKPLIETFAAFLADISKLISNIVAAFKPYLDASDYYAGRLLDLASSHALSTTNSISKIATGTNINFNPKTGGYNDSNSIRNLDIGTITHYTAGQKAATDAVKASTMAFDAWKQKLEDIFGKLPTKADNLRSFAKTMRDSMTTSFMDIINGSKSVSQAFASMAQSIIQSIEKMIFEQTVATPLTGAITSMIGNALGVNLAETGTMGRLGSAPTNYNWTTAPVNLGSGSIISGARAGGGAVWAGQSYEVGESGKETFTPAVNGTISAAGSGVTVNHYINVQAGVPEAVAMAVKQAVASSSKQAAISVVDTVRRGGRISRSLRNQ